MGRVRCAGCERRLKVEEGTNYHVDERGKFYSWCEYLKAAEQFDSDRAAQKGRSEIQETAEGSGRPRCPECGFRIRGDFADHQKSEHHINGKMGSASVGGL